MIHAMTTRRLARRPVNGGRVQCPRWGDIDVERCYGCPRLAAMEIDGANGDILCRPPAGRVRLPSPELQWPRSAAPAA